jgi:hypothetical protein
MNETREQGEAAEAPKSGRIKLWFFSVIAAVALGGIYMMATGGQGGVVEMNTEGVKISLNRQDNFADILKKAIAAAPETVEVLLGQHGYYNINSTKLVDAISRIDAANQENRAVTEGMRQLLWDLDGPFTRPGTLTGADERLMGALEELEEVLRESGETSKLLAELWQRSLERTSVFRPRSFNANITLLNGASEDENRAVVIYACPGSDFVDKEMTLWTQDGAGGLITGTVVSDVRRFDCGNSRLSLQQLLAGQPANLALDLSNFNKLVGSVPSGASTDTGINARFQVQPKDLTAKVSQVTTP